MTDKYNLALRAKLNYGRWTFLPLKEVEAGEQLYYNNVDYIKGEAIDVGGNKWEDRQDGDKLCITDTCGERHYIAGDTIVAVKRY